MNTPTKQHANEFGTAIALICSTEEEKGQQIANVLAWQQSANVPAPESATEQARAVRSAAAALTESVKTYSLGQISHAWYDVVPECKRIV